MRAAFTTPLFRWLGLSLLLLSRATAVSGAPVEWQFPGHENAPPPSVPVGVCAPPPTAISAPEGLRFRWANPLPQGDNLLSVWGAAPDAVWAVGDRGRILHFDGHGWHLVNTGVMDYLAGVWGAGAGDVFAAGYNGRILHFDGTAWTIHPTGVSNDFNGIWGSGPADVFAVGDRGVIFHYDGTCWMRQETYTQNLFFGVWGTGPTDVWAVGGRSNVAHYDGKNWSPVKVGVEAHFVTVWGTGADNLYAGGNDGVLVHKTAGGWAQEDVGTRALIRWIWGSGPDDVWLAGDEGVIRHFDGARWTAVETATPHALRGAWQAPDGTSLVVGDNGLVLSGGTAAFVPLHQGVLADLLAVDGNWAVGESGTVLFRMPTGQWQPVETGIHTTLTSVAALPDGSVLAGGEGGIWKGTPQGWRRVSDTGGRTIYAIRAWGSRVIAVGDDGLVLANDGRHWHRMISPAPSRSLYGIGGNSIGDFWVVGEGGAALHFYAGHWQRFPTGGEDLMGVSRSGYAVGLLGGIFRWDGAAWRRLADSPRFALKAVTEDGAGRTWVAGDVGTILEVRANQIVPAAPVTGQGLWGISAGRGRLAVVGEGGTILERMPEAPNSGPQNPG